MRSSADLWIANSLCTVETGCNNIPLLNDTLSTTSIDMNTSFSVKYGSGSASGDIHQDYVSFAGYNVSSQAYAQVDTVSTDLLSGNISGLMGESLGARSWSSAVTLLPAVLQASAGKVSPPRESPPSGRTSTKRASSPSPGSPSPSRGS